MAGRGPAPKSAATRARRNKTSTAARFETDEAPREFAPPLGEHPDYAEWHRRTVIWWDEVWKSPMATEYLRADENGLFMLAVLVDRFWREPDPKVHAEIRLAEVRFGLTPIDRRRLQWEIHRVEQAEREKPKPSKPPKRKKAVDPRELLRAI